MKREEGRREDDSVINYSSRPNGMHFTVPEQSVEVPRLSVGDVVTFSYESFSRKHIPVNPIIHRLRTDLSWHHVINAPQLSYGMKRHYTRKITNTNFHFVCFCFIFVLSLCFRCLSCEGLCGGIQVSCCELVIEKDEDIFSNIC